MAHVAARSLERNSSNTSGDGETHTCPQVELLRGRDGRDGRDGVRGEPGAQGPKGDRDGCTSCATWQFHSLDRDPVMMEKSTRFL
ncbi:hypothetical protein GBAR_LOCUS19869 [Geodia barretti]|uniref:Uncharacterized protein n=1 Tax=Geodia barretti TaxID=519541 RepID=A0AA35X2G8_GEOBA|nr:hypothetical protein GBAR_LOCUS19869 [Geodia barretti]